MKVITIGRSSDNNITINDPKVSRHHCQIVQFDNGTFGVVDFNSTNGTYVNGRLVHGQVHISDNDVVKIGDTTLPWRSYFFQEKIVNYSGHSGRDSGFDISKIEGMGILVLLSGLASLGIVLYLFINYFTSFGGQLALQFGSSKSFFQLFSIYLRGYFGIGGHWFGMIAAVVFGGLADLLDSVLDTKDSKTSSLGVWLGNAGVSIGLLFIVLALFAKQIAGM